MQRFTPIVVTGKIIKGIISGEVTRIIRPMFPQFATSDFEQDGDYFVIDRGDDKKRKILCNYGRTGDVVGLKEPFLMSDRFESNCVDNKGNRRSLVYYADASGATIDAAHDYHVYPRAGKYLPLWAVRVFVKLEVIEAVRLFEFDVFESLGYTSKEHMIHQWDVSYKDTVNDSSKNPLVWLLGISVSEVKNIIDHL